MNKTEYFVFHKEWYELKKELSTKAWMELEDYMLKLRFDDIDTDPKSIKNKTVRLQWIMIRKKIHDSINNMKRQKKHRNKNTTDNNPSIENDTDVHQEGESPPEEQIDSKINNIKTDDKMGILIGTVTGFEPAIEIRSATSQPSMEELQKQTEEREKRKEEYAANFKKAFNIEVPEPTPQPKEVSFAEMSKCIPQIHMDIALKQIKKYLPKEENIMRLNSRLSSLLECFSKEDRNRYYEHLIETHLK